MSDPISRRRLLSTAAAAEVRNLVVLTGDRHATWVCDLKPDFDDPSSPVVGTELTGTSISSGGNPDVAAFHRTFDPIKDESPARIAQAPRLEYGPAGVLPLDDGTQN